MSMGVYKEGEGGSEDGKGVREVGRGLVGVLLREETNSLSRLVSHLAPQNMGRVG